MTASAASTAMASAERETTAEGATRQLGKKMDDDDHGAIVDEQAWDINYVRLRESIILILWFIFYNPWFT